MVKTLPDKKITEKEMLMLEAPREKDEKPKEEEEKKQVSKRVEKKRPYKETFFTRQISAKTFLVTHILLLIFGLTFLGWMYYTLYHESGSDKLAQYSPVTHLPISFNLEVSNPDDDLLVNDKNILVSGTTIPSGVVIISVDGADSTSNNFGVDVNGKGGFSKIVPLSNGLNRLTITAFDSSGNIKSLQKTVYFSEEKLDDK